MYTNGGITKWNIMCVKKIHWYHDISEIGEIISLAVQRMVGTMSFVCQIFPGGQVEKLLDL
jgi:hypothetical protein